MPILDHGGKLLLAAKRYQIPSDQWMDLSTGINPNSFPIPTIPNNCWQRLPEDDDELISAAQRYYQCNYLLPVAGSQSAIQQLPFLRPHSKVGVLVPAYAEHAHCWKQAGHDIIPLKTTDINQHLPKLDVLIIINPNNPSGDYTDSNTLLSWLQTLNHRNGWLIVDEAFIDTTPEHSLTKHAGTPGLIILRSMGKFFGLAGIRMGFVIAEYELLNTLQSKIGPWTISNPSRYIATAAFNDQQWQNEMRETLKSSSKRLQSLLTSLQLTPSGGCDLFQWVKTPDAATVHHYLAQNAILTRLFSEPSSLRFGLPALEKDWQKLASIKR